jgi:hypothetical protein
MEDSIESSSALKSQATSKELGEDSRQVAGFLGAYGL